jgi:hypothetical protein
MSLHSFGRNVKGMYDIAKSWVMKYVTWYFNKDIDEIKLKQFIQFPV